MGCMGSDEKDSGVVVAKPACAATINIAYVVPKDKAEEVEATFMKHAAHMEKFYAGSVEHLISCYFTKAPQFVEPTDPSKGETDNMIFTINEEFATEGSVPRHIENAKPNDYFPDFGKIMHDYGVAVQPMGSVFFKLESARAEAPRPATAATINIAYVVPKDKAEEVEATFMKHAAHMEKFYAGSVEHLISCYFTKAPQFVEPTDPSKGETDNMIFTINEEFATEGSVPRHIENAKPNDYFPDFGKIMHDYGVAVQPMGSVFFKLDYSRA